MTPTEQFIQTLAGMKSGEKTRFRLSVGARPDQNAEAFDLFTGIWWPLRQQFQNAPKREIAWIVCGLFSLYNIPHVGGQTLPIVLSSLEPGSDERKRRYRQKLDDIFNSSVKSIPDLFPWALHEVYVNKRAIDWAQLTDDLSIWDSGDSHRRKSEIKRIWLKQYVNNLRLVKTKGQ